MDSRTRVFTSLEFNTPDRTPRDFWASTGFYDLLKQQRGPDRERFLDLHDIDLRYIEGPRYIGPRLNRADDGRDTDLWGVHRRNVRLDTSCGGREVYSEVACSPLAKAPDVDAVRRYPHWPSPDWFDYTPVKEQCRQVRRRGRVAVFMGDRLNRVAQLKPAMYLRGIEQIFLDMAAAPDIAAAIFASIRTFYRQYLERIMEAADGGIDIVLTGDDFGTQNGLLLSPVMWRQFLAEGFREYIDLVHAYNARCMHHTCGRATSLVPDMVDAGLDVLQSLQPEAMAPDLPGLKHRFDRRLAFHGGISVQRTLPLGTPCDVRREVRERLDALAPGGGYILCTAHNIQADCPLGNVDALLDAYATGR